MNHNIYMEEGLEKLFIKSIEELGYTFIAPQDIQRDSKYGVIDQGLLKEALRRIHPSYSDYVLDQAIQIVSHIDLGLLIQRNEVFFDYLQNGIEVPDPDDIQYSTKRVYLIDDQCMEHNSFVVTHQLTIIDQATKRPDILIYINGLPLIVIELKSMTAERSDIHSAYRQIKNYQQDIESLFVYNAFNIISDFTTTRVGTITANETWYKPWKSVDGSYESTKYADYKTLLQGMLDQKRLLDIIKHFIFFEERDGQKIKILAQYHQYFAVRKAVTSTLEAIERKDGRGGVFWHTQGSGKSLSMVFYVAYMQHILTHPTFVILTDRNDLDMQLYQQFSRAASFLRQHPVQAKSRAHLKELLQDRASNGIFFTTLQKFFESEEPLTDREDVIVVADEAHRSQYGLKEQITEDGHIQIGFAKRVRQALPKATYIGFTGTPISEQDKDTQEVFGDYIDIYDMSQAIEDGATKPIFYENRVIDLRLDEPLLQAIDDRYEVLSEQASAYDIEASKKELGKLAQIIGSEEAIDRLVRDMITHYETHRAHVATGKAMIVAYNREIAMDIYHKMLKLRPQWEDKVHVVMTSSNNDPESWKAIIGTPQDKETLAKRFKDNEDPFKIAIVVDMWLTGFDVPSLSTLYVYKPMKGHNLMQAIARVNRTFKDKAGGLVVDYIGLGASLKEAIKVYTPHDQVQLSQADIKDSAYPLFQEKLEEIRYLFKDFDYHHLFGGKTSSEEIADLITEGINYIFSLPMDQQEAFKREAYALKQAHSLCSSVSTDHEQREAAFFEAIRTSIVRITQPGQMSKADINQDIAQLIDQAIYSKGVINVFQDFKEGFRLSDPKFLKRLAQMDQKHLSIELLNRLLSDEIKVYQRKNRALSMDFSEKLKQIMDRYRSGMVDNAEQLDQFLSVVSEKEGLYHTQDQEQKTLDTVRTALIELAKEIVDQSQRAYDLSLTDEEMAFYYALSKPENATALLTDDTLIALTKELTEMINQERTPDWYDKESGQAHMQRSVKRLLTKYKYPKEKLIEVVPLIMEQAELFESSAS